jgi:hypothetical protein
VIFLLQDVFQAARECYPEEIGVKEISEKSGRAKDSINRTIRVFYKKKYQKCPERYPVLIEKKKVIVTRINKKNKIPGQNFTIYAWRVKWRPTHAREM